ncbi:hypothetical protein SLEP1_g10552 [Rubroshorea leprosula]|uniref:Reverse transcriptase domain-containing protein n=1 Tax=Rubroshorea leprosula TaxID=152421 RepID=A0AAV5I8F1_9ROSI|nr:hypothetical protein SLEP1_g10552 [Rubroshorea leprosula]
MWETLKEDVMGYFSEFHNAGRIVKGANTSFLALIPKVDNPQKIEEYRPISLINSMYKMLSKVLENRLKTVMDDLIGEQQSVFVGGKQLVDCMMVANEVLDEARNKMIKGFCFKVDFEKAYDRVSWAFLDYMLKRMGFNHVWCQWMKECMHSSTKEKGLLKGLKIGNGGIEITHLQFANDMIMFGRAEGSNIWIVKCIMRVFELVSGLKINFDKSLLYGLNVEEEWLEKTAWSLNCRRGPLPFKYLGIPIGGIFFGERRREGEELARLSGIVCKPKEEGGLRVRDLRTSNIAILGKWWGRMAVKERVLWKRVLNTKYGVEEGRWLEWVRGEIKGSSYWWRDLCRINSILPNRENWLGVGFNINLGDGGGIKFWKDVWLGEVNLATHFPRLFLLSTGKDNKIQQMGEWHNNMWQWKLTWRQSMHGWEEEKLQELSNLMLNVTLDKGQQDAWCWRHTKEGIYTAKLGYLLLRDQQGGDDTKLFRKVWNKYIPNKICAFNWMILLNRIPTKTNLRTRGILKDDTTTLCGFCEVALEDTNHLFLECPFVVKLWWKCQEWWGLSCMSYNESMKAFVQHVFYSKNKWVRQGWETIWFGLTWTLCGRVAGSLFSSVDWIQSPVLCLKSIQGLSIQNPNTDVVLTHNFGVDTKRKGGASRTQQGRGVDT